MNDDNNSNILNFCDCDSFSFGDFVRSRQNPHLTGQVIGERGWGDEYMVRLADGATTIWWHSIEIEHDPDAEIPCAEQDDDTNVVHVDFTNGARLRADSKTEGVA